MEKDKVGLSLEIFGVEIINIVNSVLFYDSRMMPTIEIPILSEWIKRDWENSAHG